MRQSIFFKIHLYVLYIVFILSTTTIFSQSKKDSSEFYTAKLAQKKDLPVDTVLRYYKKAIKSADFYKKIRLKRKRVQYLAEHSLTKLAHEELIALLKLAQEKKLRVLEGIIYADLSEHYYFINQMELCYKTILASKNIFESISDKELEQHNIDYNETYTREEFSEIIFFNIATIAIANKEYDKAERYLKESLLFYTKKKDEESIIDVKINFANLYFNQKQYLKSNTYLDDILKTKKLKNVSSLSIVLYTKALNFLELDSLNKATKFIDKSIDLLKEKGSVVPLAYLLYYKSKIEAKYGHFYKQEILLQKALKGAINVGDLLYRKEIYKDMVACELALGKPDEANRLYKDLIVLNDSLGKLDDLNEILKIDLENKLEIQESKNRNKQSIIIEEKKTFRLLRLVAILGMLSFLALFYTFFVFKKSNARKLKLATQKNKIKEADLEKQQITFEIKFKREQENLAIKKKELLLSLSFTEQKKERLKKIIKEFDKFKTSDVITKLDIDYLKNFFTNQSKEMGDIESIQQKMDETHKDFFIQLLHEYPNLSKTELRVLAYMRVGLETKDVAEVQYVSIDAIRKSRYRIRKKLSLKPEESLEKFILNY